MEAEAAARALLAETARRDGEDTAPWAAAAELLAKTLLRQEKTNEASLRDLTERALRVRERAQTEAPGELIASLRTFGDVLVSTGDSAGAKAAYERALALMEQPGIGTNRDRAGILNDLGTVQLDTGERDKARANWERARQLGEAQLDPRDPEVAMTLESLATLQRRDGNLEQAQQLYARALRLRQQAAGPDSLAVAGSLMRFEELWVTSRDFGRARAVCERVLTLRQRAVGPDHPLLIRPLISLGFALWQVSEFDAARASYERAFDLLQRYGAPNDRRRMLAANGLGQLLAMLGEYEEARPYLEQAVESARATYGPTHPNVAAGLNGLASLAQSMGDYATARSLFEQVVAIDEQTLGPEHPYLAGSLNNLGAATIALGDPAKALELFERSLAITEKSVGPDHPTVGRRLHNVAATLQHMGEQDRAEQAFARSIALLEKAGPDVAAELAMTLSDHSRLLIDRKQWAAARADIERALAIRTQVFGAEHSEVAQSQYDLGILLWRTADLPAARAQLQRAADLFEKTLGPAHPTFGRCLQDLARVCLEQRDWPACVAAATRAEQIGCDHLRLLARGLSEREALEYAAVRAKGAAIAVAAAAAAHDTELTRAAWDAVLHGRALVLDEMAARRRMAQASADPQVRARADLLQRARTHLASLVVRGPAGPPERARDRLARAQVDKERLERDLAGQLGELQRQTAADATGFEDVQRALPRGAALLCYARAEVAADSARMCAFVVRADRPQPRVVALAPPERIAQLVEAWRRAVLDGAVPAGPLRQNAERAVREAGERLRATVWDPIAAELAGASTVFVVPDGALQWVNLGALPEPGAIGYLIEKVPLCVLTSERDLLEAGPPDATPASLLAMGGPDFNATPQGRDGVPRTRGGVATSRPTPPAPAAPVAAARFRGARSDCQELATLRFAELPGAAKEAAEVAAIFARGRRGRGATEIYAGAEASETRLWAEAPSRRVLHLATHGFFLSDSCATAGAPPESPLLRSGLALAGANLRDQTAADHDDGILTAEEIASLDLDGVQWVVLSACNTGLGEAGADEGVLGLRRAFRIAGARTLVVSLWPVDDQATRRWMSAFYRARCAGNVTTAAAVRSASLAVLHEERAAGRGTPPLLWAAFMAVGAPR